MGQLINLMEYKNSKEEEKRRIKEEMSLSRKYSILCNTIHRLQESEATTFLTRGFDESWQIKSEEIIIDDYVMNTIVESLTSLSKDIENKIKDNTTNRMIED